MSDDKPPIPLSVRVKAAILGGGINRRPNPDNAHMDAQPKWFQEMHGYTPESQVEKIEAERDKANETQPSRS